MSTHSLLEALDIDDFTLLRIQIRFEEQSISFDIEDHDEVTFTLTFENVRGFFTNTPPITAFPQSRIVSFQWQQITDGLFRAELFLDIQFSSSVLIVTVIFETLRKQSFSTIHFPTLLL